MRVSNAGPLLGQGVLCWPIAGSECLILAHCWVRVSNVVLLLGQSV